MTDSPAPAPETLLDGLARQGIRGRPGRGLPTAPGTYTLDCPRCQAGRRGSKSASLHLKIDPDGLGAVWSCFNSGDCPWNAGQAFRCRGAGRSDGRGGHRPRTYRLPPVAHVRDPEADVLAWFAKRGIGADTVAACGVRSARVWMPQTDREEAVIAYPFRRTGEVINWKYRTAGKLFRQEKDAERIVFGWDDVAGTPEAIIVEGENDKMALWEVGIRHVASVPDGAPERLRDTPDPADPKFAFLLNCPAFLPVAQGGCPRLVLALDSDGPGRAMETELARRLGPERCWLVRWPEGCNDANDVLLQHGPEELQRAIAAVRPYPLSGLREVWEQADEMDLLYDEGLPGGVSLGWRAFDAPADGGDPLLTLRPGELVILTGTPGAGKSIFWNAVMVNVAREHGWQWGVCSLEARMRQHVPQLAEQVTRKPFRRGPTERMTREQWHIARDWIGERFHFIESDDAAPGLAGLLEHAQTLVLRYGIRGLLIDPYTEIAKDRRGGARDTDMVEEFLTALRAFARTRGVLVVVVAHPAKPGREAPKVMGLYDISGSAHWANKADVGLSIWRDTEAPGSPVEVHMKKIRFSEVGRMGSVAKLAYAPSWRGYRDPVTGLAAPPSRPWQEREDDTAAG